MHHKTMARDPLLPYTVYILRCNDHSFYTGITSDLEERLREHQQGIDATSYTHTRRPITAVYHADFREVMEAIAFEKQVKGWSKRKKEALIAGQQEDLEKYAQCKNETHSSN